MQCSSSERGSNNSSIKAPAGSKRISNLLRSPKWNEKVIRDYLAAQGRQYVENLPEKEEEILMLWDESVQEKPESIESEGLCPVRSSKGKRLTRIKRGYYDPPTKKAIHVPGLRWVGLLLCGMREQPQVAGFVWWSSRGKHTTKRGPVLFRLPEWAREQFSSAVLHVFDRGFVGSPWVGILLRGQDRFLLRWPSAYQLFDEKGRLKRASLFSVGKKATSSKQVWDMNRKCSLRRNLLWMPCLHKDYDIPLTLTICRPGKKGRQPWYLLTNERIKDDGDAWKMATMEWQIEQSFRFSKSELANFEPDNSSVGTSTIFVSVFSSKLFIFEYEESCTNDSAYWFPRKLCSGDYFPCSCSGSRPWKE